MSDYTMPTVKSGQRVWWYPDCDTESPPTLGFAHTVGSSAIEILTMDVRGDATPRLNNRVCVHHADDPALKKNGNLRTYGCWKHHPDEMVTRNLVETVAAQQQQLDVLTKELARRKA